MTRIQFMFRSSRSLQLVWSIKLTVTNMLSLPVLIPVVLILLYYIKFYIKWRHGPPGPFPLPIIGNLLQLIQGPPNKPSLALARLSSLYGDVFRMQLGTKDFVVLSSVDAIVNIYNKDEALGRDTMAGVLYDRSVGQNTGIITAEGKTWETNRKWTFKTLSKLGLKKGSGIQDAINEQCGFILQSWIDKLSNCSSSWTIIEVDSSQFVLPVTRVVFRLVMGDRIYDSSNGVLLQKLKQMTESAEKFATFSSLIDAMCPILGKMFPTLTGRSLQLDCHNSIRKAAYQLIDDVRKGNGTTLEEDPPTITHAYLQHMQKNPSDTFFSDFHFTSIYMDLLQGSSETTNSYIQSLLLFSVVYQHCQDKICAEIRQVLQKCGTVTLEHKKEMPYTEAFMLETQRTVRIVSNLVPHFVTSDFQYGNYRIPKGTVLIADMYSANNDTRIWKNPSEFEPNRFLDSERKVSLEMRRQCLTFGTGRRMCPGVSVAECTAFLFFVNILRNFNLCAVPGEGPPETEMPETFITAPSPFRIAISKRLSL